MKLTRRRFLLISAAAAAPSAAQGERRWEWRGDALGAEARIVLRGERDRAEAALSEVAAEIERLEAIFSLHRSGSQLARLNRDGALSLPARDLAAALERAGHWHTRTEGAFDPAVQPLWDFLLGDPLPLERVRGARLEIRPGRIALSPGTALTLNGIAQGLIADRVAELLLRRGYADATVDTGEMRLVGPAWRRLALPAANRTVELADCAAATSEPDAVPLPGNRHHLFDPRTGASPRHWRSVTVITDNATDADALSTAFAVSSRERIGDLVPDGMLVLATAADGSCERFGRAGTGVRA